MKNRLNTMPRPTVTTELIDHHRRRAQRRRDAAIRRTMACALRRLGSLLSRPLRGSAARPAKGDASRRDVATVVALALAPAIGLGVARFAYALVLPDMRADLGWSYADAGWMNTANAAGYFLGASLAARAMASAGAYRVMLAGAWACVAALLLCALFRHAMPLNAARLLAGFGGGLAFVSGGVLAAGVAERNPERAAFLLGL